MRRTLMPYEIVVITESNHGDVWDIFNTNQNYFMVAHGKAADKGSVLYALSQVPPNFDVANKYFVGVWHGGKAIAVIDLAVGYPNPDCLWLGLLLVHGDLQGKSIGAKIADGIVKAAQMIGFGNIRLGVAEANIGAIRFWNKMHFVYLHTNSNILVYYRSIHETTS